MERKSIKVWFLIILFHLILGVSGPAIIYFSIVDILITEGAVEICTSSKYQFSSNCSEYDGMAKVFIGLVSFLAGVFMLGILATPYILVLKEKRRK